VIALTDSQRDRALALARDAISDLVLARRMPERTGELGLRVAGLFVTLHLGGALRGCIGTTAPEILGPTVQRMAVAAASRDPRFSPVVATELDLLDIQISVLTRPEPIRGAAEITIGIHGLTIERGERRGLLLPQVASERSMSPAQFVDAVCLKAGLDPSAIGDPGTLLARFRAEVFGEPLIDQLSEN
jgi:AmmeMemoRadiSam system protein A